MEGNNTLQVFSKDEFQVRTLNESDGSIWFVAKDVAHALDYAPESNPSRLMQSVPEIWKGVKRIHTLGGEQEMLCLMEQGVYFFLGRSDKPKALPYQMWIAGEVVPSIRKHGAYMTPAKMQEVMKDPDVWIQVLQALKGEQQKVKALEAQAEQNKPKVIFAESVEMSKGSILIRELAKLLKQNGCSFGQNRLFAELRRRGYLIKSGSDYNLPTQKSMELGLMEILTRTVNRGKGEIKLCKTPKITGKGQVYFVNMFMKECPQKSY